MAGLDHLRYLYGKTRRVERLFLVLLVVYLLLRWTAPGATFTSLVGVALVLTGFMAGIRWARKGIRAALWRLRNRLVVAYLLIAVVPIALILALAYFGSSLLTGQIALYLVSAQLERRADGLMGAARALVATPPETRENPARRLAPFYQDRYPGLELFVRNGREWRFPENASITAPPPGHAETAGLLRKAGQSYLWANARSGSAVAVVMEPLTREVLNRLVPNLGDVSLVRMTPAASAGTQIPNRVASAPAQVPRIPPAANWLDAEVPGFNVIPVPLWESPRATEDCLLVVTTRPSALLSTLFGRQMDWSQGDTGLAFLVTAGLFLLVELVALRIGISLTRTITGAVHELHEGTQRVTQGNFSHPIPVRGNDQLADLGVSFNHMTENLERLLRIEKEKERLQSEIEIASEVQNQLYPKSVPSMPRLELKAYCSPARMVSGDYYDYLSLTGAKVALAIGDVSGKGISAALLMATVQSCLRTQIRACLESAAPGECAIETARLVTQLNQQLFDYTPVEKFATFYFAVYDDDTGLLSYTNAGHPPPILVRDGRVIRLETNGMVVGAFSFADYEESQISLQPGDLLVCYTDGITEPENEYGEMFGEDRLADLIVKHSRSRPQEVVETVFAAVRQWSSTPEAQDDMTMLVARRL